MSDKQIDMISIWDLPLNQVIGSRYGNTFMRAGLTTLRKAREAIVAYGIWKERTACALGGKGEEWKYIRGAGVKMWGALLNKLEELGFAWQDHNMRYCKNPLAVPTKEQLDADIQRAVRQLTELLEKYLATK